MFPTRRNAPLLCSSRHCATPLIAAHRFATQLNGWPFGAGIPKPVTAGFGVLRFAVLRVAPLRRSARRSATQHNERLCATHGNSPPRCASQRPLED